MHQHLPSQKKLTQNQTGSINLESFKRSHKRKPHLKCGYSSQTLFAAQNIHKKLRTPSSRLLTLTTRKSNLIQTSILSLHTTPASSGHHLNLFTMDMVQTHPELVLFVGIHIEIKMAGVNSNGETATEIVFFDLETTVPSRTRTKFCVLEFGAIVVCPRKLVELESYCTLIRPKDLSVVSLTSGRTEGITREAVASAPMFEDVADRIFSILDGRVWAGHNIQRFDCARIREAFADTGRPAPVPVGMIDSLGVLTQKFGRRAGNMKMATLASYFGLGQQKHRSLADVRMNLEVLKHCATVLFLEASLPNLLTTSTSQGSPTIMTRSRTTIKPVNDGESSRKYPPTSAGYQRAGPYPLSKFGKMTESMKNVLHKAQGSQPLGNLLKHSHLVLR